MALVGVTDPPDGSTVTASTEGLGDPNTVKATCRGERPISPTEIEVPLMTPHSWYVSFGARAGNEDVTR